MGDPAGTVDIALLAICALDVAASAALAVLFFHLSRHDEAAWLRRWSLGWLLIALAESLITNDLLGRPIPHVHVLAPPLATIALLLVVAGTLSFLGRRYSHGWTAAALAGGAATVALDAAGVDPVTATAPALLALGTAIASSGWALAQRPGATRLAGIMLIAWAIHAMDYAIVGDIEWFKPFGIALSAFLQVGAALGLLLAHLERTRTAAQEAAAKEHALIEHASVGIFRVDGSGRFILANPALLALIGFDELATLQRSRDVASMFTDSQEKARFLEALAQADDLEMEGVWARGDGARRQVQLHGRSVVDAAEPASRCFEGFVVDVTERRRLEAQLDASRRLQAVGRLTGGIAHDFNNLLTVIQGNLAMAMRGDDDGLLSDAMQASERAAELTGQLLSFARSQRESDGADLVLRAEVLVRLLERTLPENVRLELSHEEPRQPVAARPTDVDQILLTLVINARDALGAAGGTIRVSTARPGESVQLRISDDGPGLAPEILETLFEPFATTRSASGGSGLGLSIVHDMVERCGGRIEVSSAPGRGTEFVVWLRPAKSAGAPSEPPETRPGTGRVLVVDDDDAVRRVTARILEKAGYEVVTAEGLAAAIERLDPGLTAVVSDVMMPDGNGFELADELRRRGLETPCVFISGYPDRARARGRDLVLVPNPYRPEKLLAALATAIESRQRLATPA